MNGPDPGIDLDTVTARTAGDNLNRAGEQLSSARNSTGGRLDSANSAKPWGTDEMGTAFEQGKDGKDGFLSTAEGVLEGWRRFGDRTAQLGLDVVTAVDHLTGADDAGKAQVTATQSGVAPPMLT